MTTPPTISPRPRLPVAGTDAAFAVRRILCIGRNYRAHDVEMGGDGRTPPFHFTKSAEALFVVPDDTPVAMPYPPRTENFHHEVELVVALGGGGRDIPVTQAPSMVWGYAVGLDMTRRDVQTLAKSRGRPWAAAKDFDRSAVCGPLHPVDRTGPLTEGRVRLWMDDHLRQDGDLSDMIWSVPELIAHLSTWMTLYPGDLIYTGTPAGVGAVGPGHRLTAQVADLPPIRLTVT